MTAERGFNEAMVHHDKDLKQAGEKTLNITFTNELFPTQEVDLKLMVRPVELIVVVASLLYKGKLKHTLDGVQEF